MDLGYARMTKRNKKHVGQAESSSGRVGKLGMATEKERETRTASTVVRPAYKCGKRASGSSDEARRCEEEKQWGWGREQFNRRIAGVADVVDGYTCLHVEQLV